MKMYIGCIVYKKGNYWYIVDTTKEWNGTIVGKYSHATFMKDIDENQIIRNWRKDHPAVGY